MLRAYFKLAQPFLVFLVFVGTGTTVFGQYQAQLSLAEHNRQIFSPAYAGSNDALELHFAHRSQWVKHTDQAIASQTVSFGIPLYKMSSGIGFHLINDAVGLQRTTSLSIDFAFHRELDFARLSLGAGIGFIQGQLNGARLRAPQGTYSDENVNHNDQLLPETKENGLSHDISVGVMLSNSRWFLGGTLANLLPSSIAVSTAASSGAIQYVPLIIASGGYRLKLSDAIEIQPSFSLRSDFRLLQIDMSANMFIKGNIWLGAGVRGYSKEALNAIMAKFGFRLGKKVVVNYAYDISIFHTKSVNNGSHELHIGYLLPMKKPNVGGAILFNPRHL